MVLEELSFEELLGAIGKKLDDQLVFKITLTEEEEIPGVEDPYKDVFIPEFITNNKNVKDKILVGYIVNTSGVKEPLYVVTFTDSKKRSYSHDKNSIFHNKGKNIYDNAKTVIVDKSLDWKSLVIDIDTRNEGNDPDKFAASI